MKEFDSMLLKTFFGIFLSLILVVSVQAQEKTGIVFFELEHDFGVIEEAGGPVEHEFIFVNRGSEKIVISQVRASCGCTTPGWSKEAVLPGDSGFVKAQYNPFNRPGPFNKTLTVALSKETIALRIKGNVKPRPKTPADDYPVLMGNLRFRASTINMGQVLSNKSTVKSIPVYNQGSDTIRINKVVAPDHISFTLEPEYLLPGARSRFDIRFDPLVRNDLGYSNEQVIVFTDEDEDSIKTLSVVATTQEYFPPMTAEERENAPRLRVEPMEYDFGSIRQGDSLAINFIMVNEGKEDLLIRKTDASCTCTRVELKTQTIRPGESETLRVVFDSSQRKAYQYKTISVFTNDPAKPTRVLIVKGKVND